jgi:hypothetical protein
MVNGIFFDLDVLVDLNQQCWIVEKTRPNVPIMKISKSDFNLIKSGIYSKQGNKIDFNGVTFYLPTDLLNKLKIKAKVNKIELSNLAISMQEFLNKDVIDHLEFNLNMDIISEFKNKEDDVYIICSRQTKRNYDTLVTKLQDKLKENGITVKNFYFISETFYNQNDDDIKFKKMRLLIQHLLGYRTDGNKFIDQEITKYKRVIFYDNNYDTLNYATDVNSLLEVILSKTEDGLRDVIKEDIQEFKPELIINKVNDNLLNKLETKKVILNLSKLVMTFESYRFLDKY